jgi:hypothetical protein
MGQIGGILGVYFLYNAALFIAIKIKLGGYIMKTIPVKILISVALAL